MTNPRGNRPWRRTAIESGFLLVLILPEVSPFTIVQPISHSRASRRFSSSHKFSSSSTDYLDKVREEVSQAGVKDEWKDATQLLSESLDIDLEQAEACCAETWNWKSLAMCPMKSARKYVQTSTPDSQQIQASLEWLKEGPLKLNDEQLRECVLETPQAYLASPESTYKQALKVAPKDYRNPEDFRNLLLKDPNVLQCTYNCADDGCNSECGNCWVSFLAGA